MSLLLYFCLCFRYVLLSFFLILDLCVSSFILFKRRSVLLYVFMFSYLFLLSVFIIYMLCMSFSLSFCIYYVFIDVFMFSLRSVCISSFFRVCLIILFYSVFRIIFSKKNHIMNVLCGFENYNKFQLFFILFQAD